MNKLGYNHLERGGFLDLPEKRASETGKLLMHWFDEQLGYDPHVTESFLRKRVGNNGIIQNAVLLPLTKEPGLSERVSMLRAARGHLFRPSVLPELVDIFRFKDEAARAQANADISAAQAKDYGDWQANLTQRMQTAPSPIEFLYALAASRHLPNVVGLYEQAYHKTDTTKTIHNYTATARKGVLEGKLDRDFIDAIAALCPEGMESAWRNIAANAKPVEMGEGPSEVTWKEGQNGREAVVVPQTTLTAQRQFRQQLKLACQQLGVNADDLVRDTLNAEPPALRSWALRSKAPAKAPDWMEPEHFERAMGKLNEAATGRDHLWKRPVAIPGERQSFAGYEAALRALHARGTLAPQAEIGR